MPTEGENTAAADNRPSAPLPVQNTVDVEAGTSSRPTEPPRVALPSSRTGSIRSHNGSHRGDADGEEDEASEFAWGPSHPCFPHPNPHVPLSSTLYSTTRIIRVKRDWMLKGDLVPAFANLYPEILDPIVTEDEFRKIILLINNALDDAFNPFSPRAWLDAFLGVATFWLWDDVGATNVKRKLAELERAIEDWNHQVGIREGVKIIPLRRTGYMTLDIQIPDPHLGPDNATLSRPPTEHDRGQESTPQMPHSFGALSLPALSPLPSSPVAMESRS